LEEARMGQLWKKVVWLSVKGHLSN